MNLRNILVPIGLIVLMIAAYQSASWPGVAAVAGGIIMWGLLHFTRLMSIMKKASDRPIGYVGSAVMLNAKLKAGVNLMHVMAMTRALGEHLSAEGQEPEVYRWTDGTKSHVTCEFRQGKLVKWVLFRPDSDGAGPADAEGSAPAP